MNQWNCKNRSIADRVFEKNLVQPLNALVRQFWIIVLMVDGRVLFIYFYKWYTNDVVSVTCHLSQPETLKMFSLTLWVHQRNLTQTISMTFCQPLKQIQRQICLIQTVWEAVGTWYWYFISLFIVWVKLQSQRGRESKLLKRRYWFSLVSCGRIVSTKLWTEMLNQAGLNWKQHNKGSQERRSTHELQEQKRLNISKRPLFYKFNYLYTLRVSEQWFEVNQFE